MTDSELLRQFVHRRDEEAFRQIVERHAALVYSAAVRQVGTGAMADDVTQSVFILLAGKAARIEPGLLAGWLVQASRFTAMQVLRNERRRKLHEQKAAIMKDNTVENQTDQWEHIKVFLDKALAKLGAEDRSAVALRFLESKSIDEVAVTMGISRDAATKRISRAMGRLRRIVTSQGVVLEVGALADLLLRNARIPCPPAIAGSAASSALSGGAAISGAGWGTGVLMALSGKMVGVVGAVLISLFLLAGAGAYMAMDAGSGTTQPAMAITSAPPATQPVASTEINFPDADIHLVGVSVGQNPKQWFTPEGQPLKEVPVLPQMEPMNTNWMGTAHLYSLYLVGHGAAAGAGQIRFQIPGSRMEAWTQFTSPTDGSLQINLVAAFPKAVSKIDGMKILISGTPWRTVAMEAVGDQTVNAKLAVKDGTSVIFGLPHDIADGRCIATMEMAGQPVKQQLRFVAVVGDKQVIGQQTRSKTSRTGSSMEIEFDCEAGAITGLELQLQALEFKPMGVIKLPAEK